MATATLQTVKYNYEDYLSDWEGRFGKTPEMKPLTEAEFRETLATYLGFSLQIGEAYRGGQRWRAKELEKERQPLATALLLD